MDFPVETIIIIFIFFVPKVLLLLHPPLRINLFYCCKLYTHTNFDKEFISNFP